MKYISLFIVLFWAGYCFAGSTTLSGTGSTWLSGTGSTSVVASGSNLIDDDDIIAVWYLENDYTDSSSNSYTLTATASPVFDSVDVKQGSYSCDFETNSSQYASSSASGLGVTSEFSIGCWVKLEGTGTIASKHGGGGNYGWFLNVRGTRELQIGISSDGSAWVDKRTAEYILDVDVWAHIVLVYDGAYLRVYKDGSELTSGDLPFAYTAGVNNSSNDFKLASGNGKDYFDGKLDEVFYFGRALTSTEVATIYSGGLE